MEGPYRPEGHADASATRAQIDEIAKKRTALSLSGSAAETAELWQQEGVLWGRLLTDLAVPFTRELDYAQQLAFTRAREWRKVAEQDAVVPAAGRAGR